jgi:hypothetical protein
MVIGRMSIGASTLSHDDALDIAAPLDADELLVIRPGVAMAIELDVHVSAAQREEIHDALVQNLENAGFTVDGNSPIKVVGSISTGPSQEITYRDRLAFHHERDVTRHTIQPNTVQLEIMYDDRAIWRYSHSKHAPHLLMTRDGESRDQALQRVMKQDPMVLGRVRIPSHIAMGVADQPYGSASGVRGRSELHSSAR